MKMEFESRWRRLVDDDHVT